jgi:hypothetical protein
VLSSPATSIEGASPQGRPPRLSVSPDQESLFERLRLAVPGSEGGWDCTIEGAGSRMRVWLAEPVTKRVVWSRSGSSAQVLEAFKDWLSMRG